MLRHAAPQKSESFMQALVAELNNDRGFKDGADERVQPLPPLQQQAPQEVEGKPDTAEAAARERPSNAQLQQQQQLSQPQSEASAEPDAPTSACHTDEAATEPDTVGPEAEPSDTPGGVEAEADGDRLEKERLEKEKLFKEKLLDRAKNEFDVVIDQHLRQIAAMHSMVERLPRAEQPKEVDAVNELEARLRTTAKQALEDITQCLGLGDGTADLLHQHATMKLAGVNKRGMPVQHGKAKVRRKKGR